MGAKRKSYTPNYRQEAAHLVIDTGRPVAQVAREIGVGEQLLGRGSRCSGHGWTTRPGRSMPTSGPSWSGYGGRTPNCGWTGSS